MMDKRRNAIIARYLYKSNKGFALINLLIRRWSVEILVFVCLIWIWNKYEYVLTRPPSYSGHFLPFFFGPYIYTRYVVFLKFLKLFLLIFFKTMSYLILKFFTRKKKTPK